MKKALFIFCMLSVLQACQKTTEEAPPQRGAVDTERLLSAGADTSNWLSHGRTWSEQRFVPLEQINDETIGDLGLAWYFDFPTRRGIEATPLIIDGVMYVTASWSMVFAIDAATGKQLWQYNPEVPRVTAAKACCDAVNRGVAAWGDMVFVGTLDGYLVALDRKSGEVRWRTDTIDRDHPYTITGAPRVVDGKVIIGAGGGEYGVRGYVSAYDAASGDMVWRFYTVPGNPDDGFENEAMEMAATTWNGEWWTMGGGGTVWDSMAYDPELDLLYIGVGNGSPWDRNVRSPGGGDNLFVSSIVALKPDTGEYVWHYQTTPGDSWDYTATQHMILADLEIDGQPRKVLMQAPKNGFFYVLDRQTGELISAENYVATNWASHVDQTTGRPVEMPGARYEIEPHLTLPAPFGGHNWHPMSFNPATGYVYFAAQEIPWTYAKDGNFQFFRGQWNTAQDTFVADLPSELGDLAAVAANVRGHLVAWDPVNQREAWRHQHVSAWNGGTLSTGGNLVFQGNVIGEFVAYAADDGERLWSFVTQTGITAGPVSWEQDGEQYVSVAVGWGTLLGILGGPTVAPLRMQNISRVLTFKLGGEAELPPLPVVEPHGEPTVTEQFADPEQITAGHRVYTERCLVCHGFSAVSGGLVPDLRLSNELVHEQWDEIVLHGQRIALGMPGFDGVIEEADSQAVRAYVIDRAQALREVPDSPLTGM